MNLLKNAEGGGGGGTQQAIFLPSAEVKDKDERMKDERGGRRSPKNPTTVLGDYKGSGPHTNHESYHNYHPSSRPIYHPTHHENQKHENSNHENPNNKNLKPYHNKNYYHYNHENCKLRHENSSANHENSKINHNKNMSDENYKNCENNTSQQHHCNQNYPTRHHHNSTRNYNSSTQPHNHISTKHHNSNSKHWCSTGGSGVRWVLTFGHLWLCCLWVLLATPVNTCADSNGCDFFGSGLEQDGRGVQPVYLSCSSGRVEWQYPRAALRVILKSPHHSRDFHACIKADKGFQGARIYLEGHRSLLPIYSADDARPRDLLRCFSSYKGQVALYVEAEPGADDLKKQVASFEYDLQTLPKGTTYDPMEECRPCSDEEMLHLFCSGDFVARGSILSVEDDTKLSHTTITFTATKIFQQTSPVFRHGHTHTKEGDNEEKGGLKRDVEETEGDIEKRRWGTDFERSNMVSKGFSGQVEVPLHCGAQAGQGDFVIMGVMRLGHAFLRCAPRHHDWKTLAVKSQSRAQCVLET